MVYKTYVSETARDETIDKKLNETEQYYCTKEKHEIYNRTI